jgi:hypothetical protein
MKLDRRWIALGTLAPIVLGIACTHSDNATPNNNNNGGDGAAPPPATTGTGALGIVTVDGKQKLYLPTTVTTPTGNNVVSVLDVGLAGNGVNGVGALITNIDLGISGDQPILSAGDSTEVFVGSGSSRNIWVIDPTKDTLVKTIQLDPSTKKTVFSTPDGYMNGIAIDSKNRKAYVSEWDGFAVINMDTLAITNVIHLNPTENFAFDPVHQKLYAPFYNCTQSGEGTPPPTCNNALVLADGGGLDGGLPMIAGLSVVDLTDGSVYIYEDLAAADPTEPFGTDPDSASVDPATQIVLVPGEFQSQHLVDFSQAVYDKTTMTVQAPHRIVSNSQYDGVAIEPTSHFAFYEHEFASNVGLLPLAGISAMSAPDADAAAPNFIDALMPGVPSGTAGTTAGFTNAGDPHGVAAVTGIQNGKPVAFVINYPLFDWVGRIDLTQMSTIVGATPGMLTDVELAPAVTYLSATVPVSGSVGSE